MAFFQQQGIFPDVVSTDGNVGRYREILAVIIICLLIMFPDLLTNRADAGNFLFVILRAIGAGKMDLRSGEIKGIPPVIVEIYLLCSRVNLFRKQHKTAVYPVFPAFSIILGIFVDNGRCPEEKGIHKPG